jgi:hypothetical protein
LEFYGIRVFDHIDISSKDNVVLKLRCRCCSYAQETREFAIALLRPPFDDVRRYRVGSPHQLRPK